MDKRYLFKEYTPNYEKLVEYGFKLKDDTYTLTQAIADTNFYFKITIADEKFDIDVYDSFTDEKYILFNIENAVGSYVQKIRADANDLITLLLDKCFQCTNIKGQITEYIQDKFAVNPSHPFSKHTNYCTFKTKENGKWFAVLMDIPAERLKLGGKEAVSIINLKATFETIQCLIDNITILPAYHMHKKSWMTILCNKNTDIEQLKKLIVESYQMVKNTK